MRIRHLLALAAIGLAALGLTACGGGSGGSGGAATAKLEGSGAAATGATGSSGLVSIGEGLKGPSGLKATVYTTGLKDVSAFAFDSQGRLWAATSAATAHANDGIYLVAQPGGSAVKVASAKGPLGLVWVGSTLYVASIGRVEAFMGFDGTHFASRRTVLEGPAGTASNLGIVQAPNGRLLMGVSTTCDHCTPASKWAASIVSFRRNGTGLELYAKRIRAAYGLTFYPGTSTLFVTMNQRDDLGTKTPGDWLAIVRKGDDWRFPGCYGQGGAACEGVRVPVAVLDRHAAVGGDAIVTGQLGPSVGNAAIVAEWQSGKVQRVALTKSGSSYTGSVKPFLLGIANPLPVTLTGDGAVLVGDWKTGTVYRIAKA